MKYNIVEWFQQNPLVGIAGTIISFLLTIWGIVIAIKSQTKKSLTFSIINHNLIKDFSEKINGLTVNFKNEKVKNFSVSKFVIWNSGNSTINKSDIVSVDPLRIEDNEELTILDYEVIQSNEKSNQFKLLDNISEGSFKKIIIEFDYIDPQQGCVIQVFHNGISPSSPDLKGKIKGIDKLTRLKNNRVAWRMSSMFEISKNKRLNRLILGYTFIGCVVFLYIGGWFISSHDNRIDNVFRIITGVASFPYLYLGIILILKRIPKNLNLFDERI